MDSFGELDTGFEAPLPFTIRARKCEMGEYYSETLACTNCGEGFYLYTEQDEPGECMPCDMEKERCFGLNMTAPIDSFWRSNSTTNNYLECLNPDACLAGNED